MFETTTLGNIDPWQYPTNMPTHDTRENLQKDVVSCTAPFVSLNTIANPNPYCKSNPLRNTICEHKSRAKMMDGTPPRNVPDHSEIRPWKSGLFWPLDFSSPAMIFINQSQVAFHLQIIKVQGALFLRIRGVLVRVVHVVVLSLQEAIATPCMVYLHVPYKSTKRR